jgi:hemerythrin-like domain-containing protein
MPLKRHPALQDYSREHHDELKLVWKIREGLKKDILPQRIIDYCIHHYNEATTFHMNNEENFILNKLPENDSDRIKILNEHAEIKEIVNNFSDNTSNKKNLLAEFAEKLEKHIRYEERIFFPRIQNEFSEEILNEIHPGENISRECPVWTDPFWEN